MLNLHYHPALDIIAAVLVIPQLSVNMILTILLLVDLHIVGIAVVAYLGYCLLAARRNYWIVDRASPGLQVYKLFATERVSPRGWLFIIYIANLLLLSYLDLLGQSLEDAAYDLSRRHWTSKVGLATTAIVFSPIVACLGLLLSLLDTLRTDLDQPITPNNNNNANTPPLLAQEDRNNLPVQEDQNDILAQENRSDIQVHQDRHDPPVQVGRRDLPEPDLHDQPLLNAGIEPGADALTNEPEITHEGHDHLHQDEGGNDTAPHMTTNLVMASLQQLRTTCDRQRSQLDTLTQQLQQLEVARRQDQNNLKNYIDRRMQELPRQILSRLAQAGQHGGQPGPTMTSRSLTLASQSQQLGSIESLIAERIDPIRRDLASVLHELQQIPRNGISNGSEEETMRNYRAKLEYLNDLHEFNEELASETRSRLRSTRLTRVAEHRRRTAISAQDVSRVGPDVDRDIRLAEAQNITLRQQKIARDRTGLQHINPVTNGRQPIVAQSGAQRNNSSMSTNPVSSSIVVPSVDTIATIPTETTNDQHGISTLTATSPVAEIRSLNDALTSGSDATPISQSSVPVNTIQDQDNINGVAIPVDNAQPVSTDAVLTTDATVSSAPAAIPDTTQHPEIEHIARENSHVDIQPASEQNYTNTDNLTTTTLLDATIESDDLYGPNPIASAVSNPVTQLVANDPVLPLNASSNDQAGAIPTQQVTSSDVIDGLATAPPVADEPVAGARSTTEQQVTPVLQGPSFLPSSDAEGSKDQPVDRPDNEDTTANNGQSTFMEYEENTSPYETDRSLNTDILNNNSMETEAHSFEAIAAQDLMDFEAHNHQASTLVDGFDVEARNHQAQNTGDSMDVEAHDHQARGMNNTTNLEVQNHQVSVPRDAMDIGDAQVPMLSDTRDDSPPRAMDTDTIHTVPTIENPEMLMDFESSVPITIPLAQDDLPMLVADAIEMNSTVPPSQTPQTHLAAQNQPTNNAVSDHSMPNAPEPELESQGVSMSRTGPSVAPNNIFPQESIFLNTPQAEVIPIETEQSTINPAVSGADVEVSGMQSQSSSSLTSLESNSDDGLLGTREGCKSMISDIRGQLGHIYDLWFNALGLSCPGEAHRTRLQEWQGAWKRLSDMIDHQELERVPDLSVSVDDIIVFLTSPVFTDLPRKTNSNNADESYVFDPTKLACTADCPPLIESPNYVPPTAPVDNSALLDRCQAKYNDCKRLLDELDGIYSGYRRCDDDDHNTAADDMGADVARFQQTYREYTSRLADENEDLDDVFEGLRRFERNLRQYVPHEVKEAHDETCKLVPLPSPPALPDNHEDNEQPPEDQDFQYSDIAEDEDILRGMYNSASSPSPSPPPAPRPRPPSPRLSSPTEIAQRTFRRARSRRLGAAPPSAIPPPPPVPPPDNLDEHGVPMDVPSSEGGQARRQPPVAPVQSPVTPTARSVRARTASRIPRRRVDDDGS